MRPLELELEPQPQLPAHLRQIKLPAICEQQPRETFRFPEVHYCDGPQPEKSYGQLTQAAQAF
jgi:hypothetical protein